MCKLWCWIYYFCRISGFSTTAVGCVPNYRLGGKLCSSVAGLFKDAPALWWDDYSQSGNPKLNCWKRATSALHVPAGIIETSLYDLLVVQFDPTVDVQQAEIELASYQWNPLD